MRPRVVLAALAVFVAAAAPAKGAGLANPGFEQGLDGWKATVMPLGGGYGGYDGYGGGGIPVPVPCRVPDGICAIGPDVFTAEQAPPGYEYPSGAGPASRRAYTVVPLEGARMARFGGPFTSPLQSQPLERYRLEQSFVVDAENAVLELNWSIFAYDYSGFDDLRAEIRIADEAGRVISQQVQGGTGLGPILKTTGWQRSFVDLSGWGGQTLHLRLEAGGTGDTLYGLWGYVDAGLAPDSEAGPLEAVTAVPLDAQTDENTGRRWLRADPGDLDGCAPVVVSLPVTPQGGTATNVRLTGAGRLTPSDVPGMFTGEIPCMTTTTLRAEYDVVDAAGVDHRVSELGGLVVTPPTGMVYDRARYERLVAQGTSPGRARSIAALPGARVRLLQEDPAGDFRPVLSAAPGLLPQVNPVRSRASGQYGWSLPAGRYRVEVSRRGYEMQLSRVVSVPPAPGDLDVGLTPQRRRPTACARLRGSALQRCEADRREARRLATCARPGGEPARSRDCRRRSRG